MFEQRATDLVSLSVERGRPTVRGSCCLATSQLITRWVNSFEDHGLDIDLSGVTFFDSCGLRAFLGARVNRHKLRVVNPSRCVVRVLRITGTYGYLVYGSRTFDEPDYAVSTN